MSMVVPTGPGNATRGRSSPGPVRVGGSSLIYSPTVVTRCSTGSLVRECDSPTAIAIDEHPPAALPSEYVVRAVNRSRNNPSVSFSFRHQSFAFLLLSESVHAVESSLSSPTCGATLAVGEG